jgi:1-acyl-sn-glycerol-3-phosphate acyltransferase
MKPVEYFYDTPSSGEGHFPQKFCTVLFGLIWFFFKILFRYKAFNKEQLEKIPAEKGFIFAGNHSSYLDPVFVMAVMRPRAIRYISKEEFLLINPALTRVAAWCGVFPVKRNTADMSAVKRAVRMLKRGELVGIFPEGTRMRFAGQESTYHEGIALIAQLAKVPVVPLYIDGAGRICPEGKRLFRLPKVTVRFGEPLSLEDSQFIDLEKDERYKAFTEEVMRRVYDLKPPK